MLELTLYFRVKIQVHSICPPEEIPCFVPGDTRVSVLPIILAISTANSSLVVIASIEKEPRDVFQSHPSARLAFRSVDRSVSRVASGP